MGCFISQDNTVTHHTVICLISITFEDKYNTIQLQSNIQDYLNSQITNDMATRSIMLNTNSHGLFESMLSQLLSCGQDFDKGADKVHICFSTIGDNRGISLPSG